MNFILASACFVPHKAVVSGLVGKIQMRPTLYFFGLRVIDDS